MWHYVLNGKTFGPVNEETARQLFATSAITPDTLVWREGMSDWQPARACPFFVPPGSCPPPPPIPVNPPAVQIPDRTLDWIAHVLGLLTGFIGPLILMLTTHEPSAKRHATEALNWQISMVLYMIASFMLIFFIVGFLLLFAIGIMDLVFCIIAAIKAAQGEDWKYPLTIRFVR